MKIKVSENTYWFLKRNASLIATLFVGLSGAILFISGLEALLEMSQGKTFLETFIPVAFYSSLFTLTGASIVGILFYIRCKIEYFLKNNIEESE